MKKTLGLFSMLFLLVTIPAFAVPREKSAQPVNPAAEDKTPPATT